MPLAGELGRRLNADQRFQFDVQGYCVIEGALDPAALRKINQALDPIEELAARFARHHDQIDSEPNPALRHGGFGKIVGDGAPEIDGAWPGLERLGLHIDRENEGLKLWVFDLLDVAPELALPLAANPRLRPYVAEMVERPSVGLFGARFQWRGAESHIHGSRDNISAPPKGGGPEAGGNYRVVREDSGGGGEAPRLRNDAFRLMYMLSDIESGGGALRVVPGSHKRGVPWQPAGVQQRQPSGNTRFEEISPSQAANFVELTGKAGTAVVFTHDLIHCSWHSTDTYRRVVHLTFSSGSEEEAQAAPPPVVEGEDEWLAYVLRDRPAKPTSSEAARL